MTAELRAGREGSREERSRSDGRRRTIIRSGVSTSIKTTDWPSAGPSEGGSDGRDGWRAPPWRHRFPSGPPDGTATTPGTLFPKPWPSPPPRLPPGEVIRLHCDGGRSAEPTNGRRVFRGRFVLCFFTSVSRSPGTFSTLSTHRLREAFRWRSVAFTPTNATIGLLR